MKVTVLGATGSVGLSAAAVLAEHRDRFQVHGLAARSNWRRMLELCLDLQPERVALEDAAAGEQLAQQLRQAGCATVVDAGAGAGERLAESEQGGGADILLAAVTGAAGLPALLKAVRRGGRILLANKEALILGGRALLRLAARTGAELIPVDSEHNAVFQCLGADYRTGTRPEAVDRLALTASGGPFLRTPAAELDAVTPEQAVRHPTWSMGAKISVDSATLMNKGLELIEASILFDLPPERLEVLVHPQSLVHALVYMSDGSVLAQLAEPDMRVPIANALAHPQRLSVRVAELDLAAAPALQFERPDLDRFPCLHLALQAMAGAPGTVAVLNAANEEAVHAFLAGRIGFADIARLVSRALTEAHDLLTEMAPENCDNLDNMLRLDGQVRNLCGDWLNTMESDSKTA